MPETTNTTEEIPLLSALPQLYSLIISCSNPKHFEITKSQLIVMVALSMHRMLTMSEVARYISSSREQATRTTSRRSGERSAGSCFKISTASVLKATKLPTSSSSMARSANSSFMASVWRVVKP